MFTNAIEVEAQFVMEIVNTAEVVLTIDADAILSPAPDKEVVIIKMLEKTVEFP